MTKKRFAPSARARQRAKNARHMPDSMLDLTDIPEATDAQLHRARRVGRPSTGNAKQLIAIRISPKVLARLRRLAAKQHKPYQTYIHELDRKSTRLNSSHSQISYAVFCLKKKNKHICSINKCQNNAHQLIRHV